MRNVMYGLMLGSAIAGCGGSEALCEEACDEWQTCTQVEGNTVNYPYDTCMDECMDEGDWGSAYVNCLGEQATCPELGNQC